MEGSVNSGKPVLCSSLKKMIKTISSKALSSFCNGMSHSELVNLFQEDAAQGRETEKSSPGSSVLLGGASEMMCRFINYEWQRGGKCGNDMMMAFASALIKSTRHSNRLKSYSIEVTVEVVRLECDWRLVQPTTK